MFARLARRNYASQLCTQLRITVVHHSWTSQSCATAAHGGSVPSTASSVLYYNFATSRGFTIASAPSRYARRVKCKFAAASAARVLWLSVQAVLLLEDLTVRFPTVERVRRVAQHCGLHRKLHLGHQSWPLGCGAAARGKSEAAAQPAGAAVRAGVAWSFWRGALVA